MSYSGLRDTGTSEDHAARAEAACPNLRQPDWPFDLKYDGFRALLQIDGTGARLVSRNRNRFRHLHPLAAALASRLRVNDAILDGEPTHRDQALARSQPRPRGALS